MSTSIKNKGFITLAPAIIISAILFALTLQNNIEQLMTVYQFDKSLEKMQNNRAVDSCLGNIQYKTLQKIVIATSSCN